MLLGVGIELRASMLGSSLRGNFEEELWGARAGECWDGMAVHCLGTVSRGGLVWRVCVDVSVEWR